MNKPKKWAWEEWFREVPVNDGYRHNRKTLYKKGFYDNESYIDYLEARIKELEDGKTLWCVDPRFEQITKLREALESYANIDRKCFKCDMVLETGAVARTALKKCFGEENE